MDVRQEIERAIGSSVNEINPVGGGCVALVLEVRRGQNERLIAKVDGGAEPRLDVEAFMLEYLAENSRLPVPEVIYSSPRLLVMSRLPGSSVFSTSAQEHAAELIGDLHTISGQAFGLERPTLIGGLHQPNDWTDSWIPFFREQRLYYMARQGAARERLPQEIARRVRKLADNLDRWLKEPQAPSLIHGDVWTTNVLASGDRITGFLDPAIYYADPEVELAFTTLFGTFGDAFFARYQEIRPLAPGFFEERRDIYNLYPLLVHVHLFGGSYVASVERILSRFGF